MSLTLEHFPCLWTIMMARANSLKSRIFRSLPTVDASFPKGLLIGIHGAKCVLMSFEKIPTAIAAELEALPNG